MPDADAAGASASPHDPDAIITELDDTDPRQPSEAVTAPEQDPEHLAGSQPGEERLADTEPDEQDEPVEQQSDPPIAFPQEHRQEFIGLLYLGRLTDTFTWLGHEFVIRTLTTDEMLDVGLMHKPYVATLGENKAYQAAIVAACVERVDGQPLPVPPDISSGPNGVDALLYDRFHYVKKNWYPPTIDAIYERFLLLDKRVNEVIEAMGNP